MTVDSATPADVVHHQLAMGLQYIDAANGMPLSGSMVAWIETVGTRTVDTKHAGLALKQKASGAALRFDRQVGRLFHGPANGTIQARILIAPERQIGQTLPPDRSISPRRIVVQVSLDAEGLPRANGDAPLGKWIFPVRLHRGVAARLSPGATAVRGQLVRADPAWPQGQPIRWAHVEARLGPQLIAATRTDDRGEYVLVIRGRPGQLPEKLQPIPAQITYFVPPASIGPILPYADLVVEALSYPDVEADKPPSGYLSKPGPLLSLTPGKIMILATQVIPP